MKNRIKLSPIFFILSFSLLFLSLIYFLGNRFLINETSAETVTTTITVGNSAPEFTVAPIENPVSSTTSPTNVGSSITFQATATDSNGDSYYLIICSSNSVSATDGGVPTCGDTTWCVSNLTGSGSQSSCSYTTQQSDDRINDWYAFACDSISSGSACSSAHQGSGDSGSPFVVNHRPNFTAVSNNSPVDPGSTVTWTTTASDPYGDDIRLLVCRTASITGDSCTGDSWCESSFVSSNPTCSYNVPSVAPTATHNAYVYIVDEFNFPASSAHQGSNVSFSINNVNPVVSSITFNDGQAVNLVAGSTRTVDITATVTDNNGCSEGEISNVYAYAYRSGVGFGNCDSPGDTNPNNCYPEIPCSIVPGTCTGPGDASANYTCSVDLQYFADPTDANTPWTGQNWLVSVRATDKNAGVGTSQISSGVNVNSLIAFDLTNMINYGGLSVGQSISPLNQLSTMTSLGNVGLNHELSGSPSMCVDFPTCTEGTPIPVANQRYSLTASTPYGEGTALTSTPVEVLLRIPKPTSTSTTSGTTYWGILIPSDTLAGTYSGQNYITGVKSALEFWSL